MDYRIEILDDPPAVVVSTSGRAEPSGWTRIHDELLADPRYSGLPLLIDHTDLDATSLTGTQVRSIARSIASYHRAQRTLRASVATQPLTFGFARMAQAHLGPDIEDRMRVFRTRNDALIWLRHQTSD